MLRSFLLGILLVSTVVSYSQNDKPNIIYILADDLGYGDVGYKGQKIIETPNIDKLAQGGMIFNRHYSGSTVCAPSRSSLLTGLHTGHTPIRGNKEINPEGQEPLPAESYTLAEMLKESGYTTGCFGKWGLGYPGSEGDPLKQGFDTFYGYNCQRQAHNYYPYHLWDNSEKVILDGNRDSLENTYAPSLIHSQALSFIEANDNEPFFLFYATPLPHAELAAPDSLIDYYAEKIGAENAFQGVDRGPRYKNGGYGSQERPKAAFAAMVHLLDLQIGELIAKLDEKGMLENTLVIFTSDNGPHKEGGAQPDYFDSNAQLRGYKRDLYEGGIRVPAVAYHKGEIQAGTASNHISAFWDMMPTIAELIGESAPKTDGISFLPELYGQEQAEHEYLYWEFHEWGGKQAVLKDDFKWIKLQINNPEKTTIELYNLAEDPQEKNNIAAEHPELLKTMEEIAKKEHEPSKVFPFLAD
jgi:arylsulfatase A-like enzyme